MTEFPWVGKITWKREQLPTPVFFPEEVHEQGSLVGYSPWDHKELDMVERLLHFQEYGYVMMNSTNNLMNLQEEPSPV